MRALRLGGLQAAGDEGTGRPSSKGPAAGGAPGKEQGRGGGPRRKKNHKSSPPQRPALRTGGQGGWGGVCERFCALFLSYPPSPTPPPPPPAIQTFYFDTELGSLGFPTPSPSLLGTWSLVNNISTRVFNAQIDPSLAPAFLNAHSPPPRSGCQATGKAPRPSILGRYFLVWGLFFFFFPKENTTTLPSKQP